MVLKTRWLESYRQPADDLSLKWTMQPEQLLTNELGGQYAYTHTQTR